MVQVYYNDNVSSYVREIGVTKFKIRAYRKAKKAFWYYFSDKFSLTINIVGLIWMVL